MGRAALVGGIPCGRSMACLAMAGRHQSNPRDQTAQSVLISRIEAKNMKHVLVSTVSIAVKPRI